MALISNSSLLNTISYEEKVSSATRPLLYPKIMIASNRHMYNVINYLQEDIRQKNFIRTIILA